MNQKDKGVYLMLELTNQLKDCTVCKKWSKMGG